MSGNYEIQLANFIKRKQEMIELVKNEEDLMEFYNKWSPQFDDNVSILGEPYEKLIDCLLEVMKEEKEITKSSLVIDFAAGTGSVGKYLRKVGWCGRIDGQDGSAGMLEVAKSKEGVYSRTFTCLIHPETVMPPELSSGEYDVVVTSSSLYAGNLGYRSLRHLANAVRVGGLIAFDSRRDVTPKEIEYNKKLAIEAGKMEEEGIWKLVLKKLDFPYRPGIPALNEPKMMTTSMFCYKKT